MIAWVRVEMWVRPTLFAPLWLSSFPSGRQTDCFSASYWTERWHQISKSPAWLVQCANEIMYFKKYKTPSIVYPRCTFTVSDSKPLYVCPVLRICLMIEVEWNRIYWSGRMTNDLNLTMRNVLNYDLKQAPFKEWDVTSSSVAQGQAPSSFHQHQCKSSDVHHNCWLRSFNFFANA